MIFLRATYDELVKAGYKKLDPLDQLFLTHRPHEDSGTKEAVTEDLFSIPGGGTMMSPRPLPTMLSPRPLPAPGLIEVSNKPLKLRDGVSLTSKPLGVIAPGRKLRIVDSKVWRRDGTQRVLVRYDEDERDGDYHTSSMLPLGWVTIQVPAVPISRPTAWPSKPMAQPQAEVASNMTPAEYTPLLSA